MSETSTVIGYSGRTTGREELALVPTPPATETHRAIPHHEIVRALIESLVFDIGVVHDEYAVSLDGLQQLRIPSLPVSRCREWGLHSACSTWPASTRVRLIRTIRCSVKAL
jgi:hypothetical protein